MSDELRGLVYSKFKSKSEMARKIGWSPQRLTKTLDNPAKQPLENIHKIMEALDLPSEPDSLRFFLPIVTTKSC